MLLTEANIYRTEDSEQVTPHRSHFSSFASQRLKAWIYCASYTTKPQSVSLVSQTEKNLCLWTWCVERIFITLHWVRVVVAWPSIGFSIELFRSFIGSHDNFARTKTYFMLMEGLSRYFPGNKSILEDSQSKFKQLKRIMYKVGKEYLGRLMEWDSSVFDLWGKQQSPHMYALRTYFLNQRLINEIQKEIHYSTAGFPSFVWFFLTLHIGSELKALWENEE